MTELIHKPKRRVCCIVSGIILTILLLLFIIGLILALTVYKPKKPIVKIQSATVQGVNSHISLPFDVQLNFTLDLNVLVENRNRITFKHEKGKTLVLYREKQVGDVDLPSGTFPAKGSAILPCRLTLQIDKFVANISGIVEDAMGGKIVLKTKTKIPGEVKLLGIFKRRLVAMSDCEIALGFPSMKVQSQECKTDTKL